MHKITSLICEHLFGNAVLSNMDHNHVHTVSMFYSILEEMTVEQLKKTCKLGWAYATTDDPLYGVSRTTTLEERDLRALRAKLGQTLPNPPQGSYPSSQMTAMAHIG